ncbi:MAG: hypothetical protein Q7S46_02255 [Gallionella sp.]|nr:hypothetical protein [Gallionella sp.]
MSYIPAAVIDVKKEECEAYIRQTKLYVTLTSAFLFAPVALVMILKGKSVAELDDSALVLFVVVEVLFACSVFSGYLTLGSLARSQDDGSFDVFRRTTRGFSTLQFRLFVAGIVDFVILAVYLFVK